jgi:dipeptidyl-peptidase-3
MKKLFTFTLIVAALSACHSDDNVFAEKETSNKDTMVQATDSFKYAMEQFADLRILRYQVKGFEKLDLRTKTLLYYLYEAALSGRDIIYDQNYKYNLAVRKTLEAVVAGYKGEQENPEFQKLLTYTKRVWFSNGIHHHYGHEKFIPEFSKDFLRMQIEETDESLLPLQKGQTKAQFITFITPIIFDPGIAAKKVNLDDSGDLVTSSAVNFYEGVTEKEVTSFYDAMADKKDAQPPSYGLNSKVVKENGKIVEKQWKMGGMYSQSIEKIVYWLEKAIPFSENEKQKLALQLLVKYYRTGDLRDFDAYNLAWIEDTQSLVDVVNGYIEVYNDPLHRKGSFESVVSVRDLEASKRIAAIGSQAQWFEDHSPILPEHKKKQVTGISAKVINAVVESGDAAPSTPIGINLPNADWIREKGSKSVNLGNIVEAYEQASGESVVNEFFYNDEIRKRVSSFADHADKLHTDMHEVIGHASGQIEDGVRQPSETLKSYASTLEEGRADLVALYYLMDQKLIDLGVMESLEYGKAAYDDYITTGLVVQLARIKKGNNIEEAHMRNRKFISAWCFEKGKKDNVISEVKENGKTYYVVNDYLKLRELFGQLLRELQRIKSKGDYAAGKNIVETYGVKIDPALHDEVLERYAKLNLAPYQGFIQPKLIPVFDNENIKDVKIEYPTDFKTQMLEYGKNYGLLPAYN